MAPIRGPQDDIRGYIVRINKFWDQKVSWGRQGRVGCACDLGNCSGGGQTAKW